MSSRAAGRLGPYELVAPLGRGGMGEVYRAIDTRLDRVVALKLLPPDVLGDPDRRARFEREARLIARLQHPHICALFDVGVADPPFLVLEFLEGQSLADRLEAGVPPQEDALVWARQVADALAYAHEQGVLHRDVKPSNVVITARGAKLLDFGLARMPASAQAHDETVVAATRTSAGVVLGTPGYMSPEQATGAEVGPASDVFAYGALLYEALTGRPAFRRSTAAATMAALFASSPPGPAASGVGVSQAIDDLVRRCLAPNPVDRPSMRDVLDTLSNSETKTEAPPGRSRTPAPASSPIVGRDRELSEITALLLREDTRIVTLAGPGGIGKTRLAIEAGRRLQGHFPGGIVFVDLTPVTDPALLGSTIARVMDVTPQPGGQMEATVVDALNAPERRHALLVLDNFEQLTAAALALAALVDACPTMKVLVTSRELLRLTAEQEYQVSPLALPDRGKRVTPESGLAVAAIALFAERARAVNPAFAVSADNVQAISDICTQLDGLPLAIELAAARMRALTPHALLGRLGRSLQVLTTGARDVPARQQTLRNTIAWSYELLSPAEQRLMRRLGMFTGGCTLDGVEAVCDPEADLGIDVLDGVASLVDKSLLVQRQQADGDTRVRMLETIREYALERLADAGELDATRRAHAAYCVVLAEEADAGLASAGREPWLTRLDLELDNCRAALDWLIARGERDWAVRLGLGLFRYWETRGLFLEAGTRIEALLRLPEEASGRWAKLLLYAGITHSNFGAFDAGQRLFEQSLHTSRGLGDRPAEAVALNNLGVSEHRRGRYAEATSHLEAALELWTALRDESAIARTLSNLGNVAFDAGDLTRARHRYTEVLRTFTAKSDRESTAWAMCHLGTVAAREGSLAEARRWFEQAIQAFDSLGMTLGTASATADLGAAVVEAGQEDEGLRLLRAALRAFADAGYTRGMARTFEELALAAARSDLPGRALRLAGAAATLRKTVGALSATERTRMARVMGPLLAADLAGEFDLGRALSLDAAVTLALGEPN